MAVTVDDVQSRVAAVVDQDEDTDNISSSDYSLRVNYINRRERMWSEVGKWKALYGEYNTLASTSTGNTSVAMPADFRMIASFPKITYDGVTTADFVEINPLEEHMYDKVTDHYVKVLGNPSSGYTMVVNPGTSTGLMASGASILVPYYHSPASLASPADVVTCPNPEYLIQGVIADIWEAREDVRFQQAKADANIILQNMLEYENTPSVASDSDYVKTTESKRGFRIGRD